MEGFCLLGCNRCPGGPLAPGVVPDAGGPGREPACPATPLEALAQDTTLQVFVQMVSRSDLDSLLNNMSAELTVFAPTNEAFERFVADPETGGADFLAGPVPELQRLLSLHVIPQVLDLDGLRRVSQLQTVDDDLAISVVQDGDTGPVRLESGGQQARLLRVDRRVCASIVHVVDNVLLHPALMPPLTLTVDGDGAQPGPEVALPAAPTTPVPQLPDALPPPFQAVGRAAAGDGSCRQLLEVLAETADLQRWAELVEASGLEDRLADPSWIVTMFAPTNAGIQLAEETLPALSEVLETSPDAVEVVVSYHIVPLHLSSWHLQRVTWLPTMVTDDLGRRLFLEANTGPSGIIGVGGRGTGSAAAVVVEDIPTCGGSLVQVVDSLLLPLQPVWMPDDSPAGARNASEAAQKLAPEAERPLPPASAG